MLGPVQWMLSGVPAERIPSIEKEQQPFKRDRAHVEIQGAALGVAAARGSYLMAGGSERRTVDTAVGCPHHSSNLMGLPELSLDEER